MTIVNARYDLSTMKLYRADTANVTIFLVHDNMVNCVRVQTAVHVPVAFVNVNVVGQAIHAIVQLQTKLAYEVIMAKYVQVVASANVVHVGVMLVRKVVFWAYFVKNVQYVLVDVTS